MANRYVRIYEGPENSNVIGFSASAIPEKRDGFEEFLGSKGYEVEHFEWGTPRFEEVINNLGGVSFAYFGIQPPLRDEDKPGLASWCAKHVDTGQNMGFLIDNRMTPTPLQPFNYENQEVIAEWY